MNIFNRVEFLDICKKLNTIPKSEVVEINCKSESYFKKMKKAISVDRRGEVVFCVLRPNGKAIAVTCDEYPEGVFRIPTGGIGHREDILEAVFREVREELGLTVEILKFAGVIKIKFCYGDDYVMFYSYVFILKEKAGRLLEDASDDEVSGVKEMDLEELKQAAILLSEIKGKWSDWGNFRHASTMAVYNFLNTNKITLP